MLGLSLILDPACISSRQAVSWALHTLGGKKGLMNLLGCQKLSGSLKNESPKGHWQRHTGRLENCFFFTFCPLSPLWSRSGLPEISLKEKSCTLRFSRHSLALLWVSAT